MSVVNHARDCGSIWGIGSMRVQVWESFAGGTAEAPACQVGMREDGSDILMRRPGNTTGQQGGHEWVNEG